MKLIHIVTIIFICGCSVTSTKKVDQLQNILGVWHLKDFHDSGYSFSQIAYLKSGKKCEVSFDFSEAGGLDVNFYINTWKIEDGYLISTVEYSNIPYIPKGDLITDAIHKLTYDELIVLMQPKHDGDKYPYEMERHIKVDGEDPNILCRVVEKNLYLYQLYNE